MKIISTSTLNSKGATIKVLNDNILKDINKLSNLVDSILSFWDGEDARSLVQKINNEVIPTLNKYYDCISDYAEYLKKVNSVFESLDGAYSKNIDV